MFRKILDLLANNKEVNLTAFFSDGTFIIGVRTTGCKLRESQGVHHLIVKSATDFGLVNKEVAIPIVKPKYWVLE